MSYSGAAPTPPRVWELWSALPARLDTARMQAILGGAGRVRLATDTLAPEGAESATWGRLVIAPVRRMYGEPRDEPGRSRLVPFLVRAELHSPGGAHPPAIALEAAQGEAFARLHGWTPSGFTHLRVLGPLWRETAPQSLPLWDEASGVWFLSSEYRAAVAPPSGGVTMSKVKRYRVARLFAHEERTYTNEDEARIRDLPPSVRALHVRRGNLVEYEADEKPPVPLAEANATPKLPAKGKE